MTCPYCNRIHFDSNDEEKVVPYTTQGYYNVSTLQRPPRTPNLAPLAGPKIVSGPSRVGMGNYEFGATFAGLPRDSGSLATRPGYAGPNNPRRVWPYVPPTRVGSVTYSPGSDPYYGSISPTTLFGGLERIGIPRADPDQYGTSRSGSGGYTHGREILSELGGWTNFDGSIS